MSSPFLKLFYFSFCSIWPGSIWLHLIQATCSFFDLLVQLTWDRFLGIVTNTCWQDAIPSKQQWQGLMCFTSRYHWESSTYCVWHILVHICCPFWTLYWQTSCLRIQDVTGDDHEDFYHSFWIILTTKGGAYSWSFYALWLLSSELSQGNAPSFG